MLEKGCARAWGWPAADGRWQDPRYLEAHPQIQAMERLFDRPEGFRPVALHARAKGCERGGVSCPMTPLEALAKLRARAEPDLGVDDGIAMYLGAWEYDADDWTDGAPVANGEVAPQGLSGDLEPGVSFARCLLSGELGKEHRMLRCLRWIYIGEPGSGTAPHIDPLATHGWMWLAKGVKEWRIVRLGCVAGADDAPLGLVPVPAGTPEDLFEPKSCFALASAWASRRAFPCESREEEEEDEEQEDDACEAWAGELREGELIFIPSGTVHTVLNAGSGLSIAVSHNYVDATNLVAVLRCLRHSLDFLLRHVGFFMALS